MLRWEILEKLVRVVEDQFTGCCALSCSLRGRAARAARRRPQPSQGLHPGHRRPHRPKAGSCGTAMYRRETVVVTDILPGIALGAVPRLAEPYGFRACWSTPILVQSDRLLGSFAMYYANRASPSPAETQALKWPPT